MNDRIKKGSNINLKKIPKAIPAIKFVYDGVVLKSRPSCNAEIVNSYKYGKCFTDSYLREAALKYY